MLINKRVWKRGLYISKWFPKVIHTIFDNSDTCKTVLCWSISISAIPLSSSSVDFKPGDDMTELALFRSICWRRKLGFPSLILNPGKFRITSWFFIPISEFPDMESSIESSTSRVAVSFLIYNSNEILWVSSSKVTCFWGKVQFILWKK